MCGMVPSTERSVRQETGYLFPRRQLKTRRIAVQVIHADARPHEAYVGAKAQGSLCFRTQGGGCPSSFECLPFGWKSSLVLYRFALSEIVSTLIPEGVVLLHYLEVFLLVSADVSLLQAMTACMAEESTRCGFIASPKSTLSPVTRIFYLGKWLDLEERTITWHPRAFLQMLAAWLRVAVRTSKNSRLTGKLVGFLQWHVRPKLGMWPLFAGAYC